MLDRVTPPPEVVPFSRDQSFDEIERVGGLLASYARSSSEAAFRGDQHTLLAALQQARLCCIYMIRMYKDGLEGGDANGAR